MRPEREALASVLVVALLATSLFVYYGSTQGTKTSTITATAPRGGETVATSQGSTSPTTSGEGSVAFASPTSEQGLQLRVVLNSSVVPANGTLGAQIALYNTLDENVSVSVTQDQQISAWNAGDFLCGSNPSGNLAGFAVFRGDVSATNLSEAGQPLELDPQLLPYVVLGCPTEEGFPANATFLPDGDRVSYAYAAAADIDAKTLGCTYTEQASQCTGTGLVGYWNDSVPTGGNLGFGSPSFVRFPPGEYTVVATDDWSQYAYATFVVQPPGASSSSSTSSVAGVNAAVATLTVTTTLITQGSQATTTYAIPTTSCTIMPVGFTTTTTITVGATPPATTTTTTVTTTSTSYTQTVTVTSCTYSESTFTSTVTTTTNP
jgi:hypothetical protein